MLIPRFLRRAGAILGVVAVSACAAGPAPEGALIADPYEATNRDVHAFNTVADRAVLRPVASAYRTVTPDLFQHLLSNFVRHAQLPVVFVNDLLQGDVDAALNTFGRFTVNTIVGAGGLLNPADEFGLPYVPNDFGLTLARAGVEEGAYVVLPFFGPSTGRDAVGRGVNVAINPLTYVTFGNGTGEIAAAVGEFVAPPIVLRAENFELIDGVLYDSEDGYVTARTAYILNRRAAVGGEVDAEDLPDIFAE